MFIVRDKNIETVNVVNIILYAKNLDKSGKSLNSDLPLALALIMISSTNVGISSMNTESVKRYAIINIAALTNTDAMRLINGIIANKTGITLGHA